MRVLVTAASKYGATAGIAEAIGRKIEEHAELDVDVVPVEEVDDLTGYDAVILGSGVYAGRWLKDARRFVGEHASDLATMPTWLFSSGPIGDPAKPEGDAAVRLGSMADEVGAIEHRVFAGRLDKSRLAFGDRAIVTAVRSPEGDFRDWEAIAGWAAEITEALAPARRSRPHPRPLSDDEDVRDSVTASDGRGPAHRESVAADLAEASSRRAG